MINKIINSEDPKYQSETISELVFDTTPTVNSFNTVTSDGIARAIAGASGEVPAVTENDNGKVLTAVYDAGGPAVEWAEAQGGDSYTAGDGIAISEDGEISAKVDGTTIQVNADGELEAIGGGGSSTITAEKPIIGDGSASAPLKLLYSSNNMKASPDEYPLTVGSGTYGTCGTIEAYSTAIYEILPAPVQFMFTGIVSLGQQMTYRCYIYCPTTQARIYGNSTTGAALGGRLYATLDVKNPGEGSTGVFDGLSYQYDWEVGIVIAGAAGAFTGVTLYSASKLNVKNPLPSTLGTAGQVLTVNSGATGVEWASPSGGGSYSAGNGVSIDANNEISVRIKSGYGLKFDSGELYIPYSVPNPKTGSNQDKFLQVTDAQYGSMGWTTVNQVPASTSSDEDKVLTVNSSGTPVWATPSGGSSGYTPVDLQAISAAPFTIPVGNREDVAVTVSNETGVLTLQLANDCTDAIVKITGRPAYFGSIQVVRGQDTLDLFGTKYITSLTAPTRSDYNILASDLQSDSDWEMPSDFSECTLVGGDIVNGVSTEIPTSDSLLNKFVIEIKGRSAILHV